MSKLVNARIVKSSCESTRGSRRGRARRAEIVGVAAWCSLLAAGAFTTTLFVLLDPATLPPSVSWWDIRYSAHIIGFFLLWSIAAVVSALALYLARPSVHEGAKTQSDLSSCGAVTRTLGWTVEMRRLSASGEPR